MFAGTSALIATFLAAKDTTPLFLYCLYLDLGSLQAIGQSLFTIAAEQFGTNLRATAASTAP